MRRRSRQIHQTRQSKQNTKSRSSTSPSQAKALADTINALYEKTQPFTASEVRTVESAVALLDRGEIRVAERAAEKSPAEKSGESTSEWHVNEWVKKAILLYFRVRKLKPSKAGELSFLDKIPTKKWSGKEGVRVVPHAIARYGSYVESGAILMPSYVNIGARVGAGTLVDTWATVGSCAQVGAHCHISGGVGLGGVLEPVQASPVIIEDHVFLGSRSIVVEGVIVREGAVLGAGVSLTSSTRIIDVSGSSPVEYRGEVPPNSVVIPGSVAKKFAAGTYHVSCALIIGKRKESTDKKTSLNQTLRDFNVQV